MSAGNKHLGYKAALNDIEVASPGAKANFYLSFLRQAAPHLTDLRDAGRSGLGQCGRCGAPSPSDICAFCRLQERAAVPREVTLGVRTVAEDPADPPTEDVS